MALKSANGDPALSHVALLETCGTSDAAFASRIVHQLINAACLATESKGLDDAELNAALAAVAGIAPRDEAEAMLAAQMVAIHNATMNTIRRMNFSDTIPQLQANGGLANKLARTYAAQLEALKRYRSKGEQRVIVERVNVNAGGQAVVGAIATGGEAGLTKNLPDRPHAKQIAHAPEPTLPGALETVGEAMQGTSR